MKLTLKQNKLKTKKSILNITTISDSHGQEPNLPGGDILFHAGDLTQNGFKVEIIKQLNYLHNQKHLYKHIIITPGNHDFWCEDHPEDFKEACKSAGIICLINESIECMGLKIYGSPLTPVFHNWAYNRTPEQLTEAYKNVPKNLDVLMTHGPPHGVLDKTFFGEHVGCKVLLDTVLRLKPKLHLFGHIHEEGGFDYETKDTTFKNSAQNVMTFTYEKK